MPTLRFKASRHADLPLHGGKVPPWLFSRMSLLGGAIVESILLEYGKKEFFNRLRDPFWFQAFGVVLGMDWHSSGITTSVMGALKASINPKSHELGLYFCGVRESIPARLLMSFWILRPGPGSTAMHWSGQAD